MATIKRITRQVGSKYITYTTLNTHSLKENHVDKIVLETIIKNYTNELDPVYMNVYKGYDGNNVVFEMGITEDIFIEYYEPLQTISIKNLQKK